MEERERERDRRASMEERERDRRVSMEERQRDSRVSMAWDSDLPPHLRQYLVKLKNKETKIPNIVPIMELRIECIK